MQEWVGSFCVIFENVHDHNKIKQFWILIKIDLLSIYSGIRNHQAYLKSTIQKKFDKSYVPATK